MTPQRFDQLLQKWLRQEMSEAEMDEFMTAARDEEFAALIGTAFEKDLVSGSYRGHTDEPQRARAFELLLQHATGDPVVRQIGVRRRIWWWVAAAAAVVLIVIVGDFYFTGGKSRVDAVPVDNKVVAAPKSTHAVLTLADGRKIALDSAGQQELAKQGRTEVLRTADDRLAYKDAGWKGTNAGSGQDMMYNSITNPRGSRVVQLTLSDGTRVWLNNETTIRYPVNFPAGERMVEVTGEAYFEVSKDAKRKFLVRSKEFTTEVLGTHFNVNSYADEEGSLVALLEGRVRVRGRDATRAVLLQPGQGAVIRSGLVDKTNAIDPQEIMAWKEGRFYFMSVSLKTVMRELERWYDVNAEYDVQVGTHFTGIISRTATAQEVFAMLEQISDIKFVVDGKRVIVTKKER